MMPSARPFHDVPLRRWLRIVNAKPTNTKRGEANDDATSVVTDNNELETSFKSRRKTKIHEETETNSVNKNQTCIKS